MSKKEVPDDLTPSICEAALDRFSQSDDSLAGIIEQHHIEVRDFMVLSLVCDQKALGIDQLARALGLTTEAVVDCIDRMTSAGLLRYHSASSLLLTDNQIQSTDAGQLITRKILDNIG